MITVSFVLPPGADEALRFRDPAALQGERIPFRSGGREVMCEVAGASRTAEGVRVTLLIEDEDGELPVSSGAFS